MRTASVAPKVRYTMTRKLKVGTALGSRGNLHPHGSIYGFDVNLGAKRRIYHTYILFTKNNVALAGKLFVWFYANINI